MKVQIITEEEYKLLVLVQKMKKPAQIIDIINPLLRTHKEHDVTHMISIFESLLDSKLLGARRRADPLINTTVSITAEGLAAVETYQRIETLIQKIRDGMKENREAAKASAKRERITIILTALTLIVTILSMLLPLLLKI